MNIFSLCLHNHAQVAERVLLVTMVTIASTIGFGNTSEARPNPDKVGVCYFFKGKRPPSIKTCVISTGRSGSAEYVSLRENNGRSTLIIMRYDCPNPKEGMPCEYIMNGKKATEYYRDIFFEKTNSYDEEGVICYQIKKAHNSVCYRANRM
jgi:hypothetical protein